MIETKTVIKKETPPKKKTEHFYFLSMLTKEVALLDEVVQKLTELDSIISVKEDLGERNLYFPIAKERKLRLASIFFQTEKENISKIDQFLKHNESIARYLITHWDAPLPSTNRRSNRNKEASNV